MSTPQSDAAAAPAASLPMATPSKLKPTAKEFNPNAASFTPAGTSAPSSTAAAPVTPATKLNPSSSTFTPRVSAPSFSPNAPAFNPNGGYVPQPQFGVPQQMRGPQMGFPMHGMVQAPNGQFFPAQPMYAPNGQPFYQPQQYMPQYGMQPGMMGMHPQQQQLLMQQQAALQHQHQLSQHQQHQQQQSQLPQAAAAPKPANTPLLASPNLTATAAPTATPAATPAAAAPKKEAAAPVVAAATAAKPTPAPAAAAEEKPAEVKPTPAATAATAAAVVATPAPVANKAAAAQSFGVTPVERYKPKTVPVGERERKPKQPEEGEDKDLKEVRQRASSSAAAADADESPFKPTPVALPTAASSSPSLGPTSSPNSRKQTTADAESSLASAITGSSLQYNRDFLLQFQSLNTTPPENLLSSIEAILKGSEVAAGGDFARPGAGLRPGSQRPGQGSNNGPSRIPANGTRTTPVPNSGAPGRVGFGTAAQAPRANNQQGDRRGAQGNRNGGGGGRQPRYDQPMDIEIVPLVVSENRFKRLSDLPADVELLRALVSILNKLTPEKFDTLVDRVLELKIETAALLRDVVTAVFEKALAEPNYSPVYAEFCVKLSARLPSFPADESDTQNTHNFKRLVLNQCQQEFEAVDGAVGENGEMAPGRVTAEAFAAMNDEEKTEHTMKLKRRTLGTIRFIGELYVRAMLAGKIMKSCIILLVGDTACASEENIEALCKLLETVGKMMDSKTHKANHEFMNTVFTELEKLAQPASKADKEKTEAGLPVLSSRLRFMIQDTLDLRRKDWVLRRKNEVNAKKISDVHKESAAAPQQDARAASARPPAPLSVSGSRFGAKKTDRYAIGSPSPRGAKADDGWETAKPTKRSQDVRGPGLVRTNSLGSTASTPRAGGAPPTPAKRADKADAKAGAGPMNAFALLNAGGDDDEESAPRQRDEEDAEEGEEEEADQEQEAEEAEEAPVSQLSDEEIVDKTKSFMKEYFTSDDFAEVKLCIKEISDKFQLTATAVFEGLMLAIEGKDRERAGFAKLLPLLVAEGFAKAATIEEGFNTMLEMAEDMGPDYPRLIEQVGGIFATLIQEGVSEFAALERLSKVITSSDDQVKFATFVLSGLKKSKEAAGADFAAYVTEAANGLKWADIAGDSLNAEQAKKHLTDKKLEMLASIL